MEMKNTNSPKLIYFQKNQIKIILIFLVQQVQVVVIENLLKKRENFIYRKQRTFVTQVALKQGLNVAMGGIK